MQIGGRLIGRPLRIRSRKIRALPQIPLSRRRILRALTGTISASILIQGTLLVTGVVLARALGPEDRGHLAFLTLVAAIFWRLGPLGIPLALNYSVARVPDRAADVIRRLRRPTVIRGAAATVIAAGLLVVLTAERPGYVQAGALVAMFTVPAMIVQTFGLRALSGLRRFAPFNLFRVGPNALFAIVALALVLTGNTGFIEFAFAWGISRIIFAPFTLRSAWRHAQAVQTGKGEAPSTSWMLRFGRRGFLGGGSVDAYRLDQAVVALFLPPAALGLYVVALAFTTLPRFIAQSVGQVATPTVASRTTRNQARRTMWRFFWIGIPLYLPVVAGLWLTVPDLTSLLFGDEFADVVPITRLLLVATALYCARRVLAAAARGAGYPGLGSIAEIVALASVFPLFAALVPPLETKGVAYALIVASTLALCVMLVGLSRPSARHAPAGASWFETSSSDDTGIDLGASDTPQPKPTSSST